MSSKLRQKIVKVGVVPALAMVVAFLIALVILRAHVSGRVQDQVSSLVQTQLARTAQDGRLLCELANEQIARHDPAVAREILARHGSLRARGIDPSSRAAGQANGAARDAALAQALEGVRKAFGEMRLGSSGDVVVVGARGEEQGVYLISPGGRQDGKSIWEAKDTDGNLFVQNIVRRAVALRPGESAPIAYRFKRPSGEVVDRVAEFAYHEPWGWIVIAGIDRAEAEAASGAVRSSLTVAGALVALLAALMLGVAACAARRVAARVAAPVEAMAEVAARVAQGDVEQKIEHRGDDEVGRLADSFRSTLAYVQEVAQAARAMARGDLAHALAPRSERDVLTHSFQDAQRALRRMIDEIGRVSRAAVEGRLTERADLAASEGAYAAVLRGVNDTLDAVIAPLHEAGEVLQRLASRDLTARVEGAYQGDLAALRDAINCASEALRDAMRRVAGAVAQVSGAAGQIASSSQQVAAGASEQAASLEETSSSLESMEAMTRRAADNARQASSLAEGAKKSAQDGAGAMEQMSSAMSRIRRASEGTSQIIKEISEIAFQTNLLALNAAVEAARAGEAGRGFAVVAEEVRSLALRAKDAAVKTEDLILQSVKETGDGQATVQRVNAKLGQILEAAQKVSEIVTEITASAQEQAQGIAQVSTAVGDMSKVTQQNAAASEQSSSAAQELSGQSEELAAMVAAFRIEQAQSTPASPRARRAPRGAEPPPAPEQAAAAPPPKGKRYEIGFS